MATESDDEVRDLFARVRVKEIVSKFNGEGDVVAWIRQVRIAKRVMRLEDADLADLASLALKDRAFAVYEEMEEGDKMDFEKIARALMTAFVEDPITAHVAFIDRKYVAGEGIDSYLNKLKRLGRITVASEMSVTFRFITGLPSDITERLRATPKISELPQTKVLDMARAMVQMREEWKEASVVMVAAEEVEQEVVAVAKTRAKKGCFECGLDHLVQNCPDIKNGVGQRSGRHLNMVTCGQRGGPRYGQNPSGVVGRADGGQEGHWVFYPTTPAGMAIEDHSSGNEYGLSAQQSARYQ